MSLSKLEEMPAPSPLCEGTLRGAKLFESYKWNPDQGLNWPVS